MNRISKALAIGAIALQTACASLTPPDQQEFHLDRGQLAYLKQEDLHKYSVIAWFLDAYDNQSQPLDLDSLTYTKHTEDCRGTTVTEYHIYATLHDHADKISRHIDVTEPQCTVVRGLMTVEETDDGRYDAFTIRKRKDGYEVVADIPLDNRQKMQEVKYSAMRKINFLKETLSTLDSIFDAR